MKWIAAIIGYFLFRFPGAVVGYFIGSLFEGFQNTNKRQTFGSWQRSKITPQDFELKLLALASLVIKADGKVSQQELDYVRNYFVSAYGKERANAVFRLFNEQINKEQISAMDICNFFVRFARYESRLQLLHFLFGIANSDGGISELELQKINTFANYLRISTLDFKSIKAMFIKEVGSAYKILEIDRSASDAAIKKAYRDLAKKHHPDKVQHLGEAYVKGAQEKFQQIQKAYEQIKRERGF